MNRGAPLDAADVAGATEFGEQSGRSVVVDTARGVAILMLMVYHAIVALPGIGSYPIASLLATRLNTAVQLFFVLGGFLIVQSWDCLKGSKHPATVFAIKRGLRIVPLYVIFLHLSIGYYWLFERSEAIAPMLPNGISEQVFSLNNYFAHLLFLEGFAPRWLNTMLDGGWFVVAVVYFSAIYPLTLARACTTLRRALVSLLIVEVVAYGSATFVVGERSFGYYFVLTQLPSFVVGVVVARAAPYWRDEMHRFEDAPLVFLAVFIFGIGLLKGNVWPIGVHNIYALLYGLLLFFSIYSLPIVAICRRLDGLRALGRMSYALFYLHMFILRLAPLGWLPGADQMGIVGAAILNCALSIGLSIVFAVCLVHPIDRLISSIGQRLAVRIEKR